MHIIKLGHCCLLIEINNVRILTDPGAWTTAQNTLQDLDAILITHEHADHLHVESVQAILKNNPNATLFTNHGVGAILKKDSIPYRLLEDGQKDTIKNMQIEGHGQKHADIYPSFPSVINTSYLIDSRFFYPGDALYNPERPVEILALPVAGPWLKLSEAIDYAKALQPKLCFPVHDGMLRITGPFHALPEKILASQGITFKPLEEGQHITV